MTHHLFALCLVQTYETNGGGGGDGVATKTCLATTFNTCNSMQGLDRTASIQPLACNDRVKKCPSFVSSGLVEHRTMRRSLVLMEASDWSLNIWSGLFFYCTCSDQFKFPQKYMNWGFIVKGLGHSFRPSTCTCQSCLAPPQKYNYTLRQWWLQKYHVGTARTVNSQLEVSKAGEDC